MIDWNLAARLAGVASGESDAPAIGLAGLDATVAESEELVGSYTGLRAGLATPRAEAIDRPAWARANLAGMRGMLEPVTERVGGSLGPFGPVARAAAGVLLAAEVGVLLGLVSRRVLGQYELDLTAPERPARLLFVAPNLAEAVRAFDADAEEVVRWVVLHEVTHALQFGGVPWLRPHLAGMLGELLERLTLKVDTARALRLPVAGDLRALVDVVRRGDLLTAVVGPEQRATLDRVQATMAVLEGHAEHVMDAVGAPLLPSLPRLRAALGRRRAQQPPLARLLSRLLGFDMKLRQYEVGKRFCDAVVQREGVGALNVVWSSPDALPTLAELDAPDAWLARTRPLR